MTERARRWNANNTAKRAFFRLAAAVARIRSWRRPVNPTPKIAWPYTPEKRMRLVWRVGLAGGLALFCFLYGAAFALLAPFLAVPIIGLLMPLFLLVIWTLPNMPRPPLRILEKLFFASFVVMIMWPGYLAIALPGLPWITLLRLTAVPFAVVLLVCLSVSGEVRTELSSILAAVPLIRNLFFLFVLLQVISILFSSDIGYSIGRFMDVQTTWTASFIAGCIIFAKDGRAERMAGLLCLMAIGLGFIAVLEFRMGQSPWVGHIPAFLKINDPNVTATLEGTARFGRARRVQTTYTTPLGFGEYLAIAFPFVLHFMASPYRPAIRVAALLAIPLMVFSVIVSQSRVGYVGYFITAVVYPILWVAYYWRRNRHNLLANAMVHLSPILLSAALGALLLVDGIRIRILGGGQEASSNQGRIDQLNMGIPKIMSHPWGYGIGRGADALGWYTANGFLTIDSYWLRLALEYGVVGFAVYIGLFGAAIGYAGRTAFLSTDAPRERALLLPISISLLNFIVIKSAFAQEDNQSIIFALFGMVTALVFRYSVYQRTLAETDNAKFYAGWSLARGRRQKLSNAT